MTDRSAADLIAEAIKLDDWLSGESKRFEEHCKPVKKRIEDIKSKLLEMCNTLQTNSMATDNGTAYISTIMSPKIVDRDKYLDFINEFWDTCGSDMLQLSAPQKEALKRFIEDKNDTPPGVEVGYFNRLNIRRS